MFSAWYSLDLGTVSKRLLAAVAMLLSMLVCPLPALSSTGLLDVQVRVPDQSNEIRRAAFTNGLQTVLVRLSGDSEVLSRLELPPAGRYVKQFRYDSIDETELQPVPGATPTVPPLQLWIQYDEDRLVDLLRENSIPVWSLRRDDVTIWFAVRDGLHSYVLRASDESRIKSAADDIAASRGVPLVWPSFDTTDRSILRLADVWGGFETPLQQASTRYSSGPMIAANLAWNGDGWVGEWYLYDASNSRYWFIENDDYASLVAEGLGQIADDLGERYAILDDVNISQAARLSVQFQGVDSVQGYRRAQQILDDHPAVRAALLHELSEDRATFDVFLRTDESDFLDRMSRVQGLRRVLIETAAPQLAPAPEVPSEAAPVLENSTEARAPVIDVPDHVWQLLQDSRIN